MVCAMWCMVGMSYNVWYGGWWVLHMSSYALYDVMCGGCCVMCVVCHVVCVMVGVVWCGVYMA